MELINCQTPGLFVREKYKKQEAVNSFIKIIHKYLSKNDKIIFCFIVIILYLLFPTAFVSAIIQLPDLGDSFLPQFSIIWTQPERTILDAVR